VERAEDEKRLIGLQKESKRNGCSRQSTASLEDIPWWFTDGKTSLIPKPGQSSSKNQRLITCLNTIYNTAQKGTYSRPNLPEYG